MASDPSVIVFASAALVEIVAYCVPWLDNLLDTLAAPVAVVAGIVATASVLVDMPPAAEWMLAVVAGGGTAALTQGGTVALRGTSLAVSGGLANFLVTAIELAGSLLFSFIGLLVPVLGIFLVAGISAVIVYVVVRARRRKRRALSG
jgi:hypothetical protein